MNRSGAAGMILSDFGKVIAVEHIPELTHTGDIVWTTTKTWAGAIVVPSGQVWALEGILVSGQSHGSNGGIGSYSRVLLAGYGVSTEVDTRSITYVPVETIDFPPLVAVLLKAGTYDVVFQQKTGVDIQTAHFKEADVKAVFRRYAV